MSKLTDDRLLPCPFCGGTNVSTGGSMSWTHVWCADCSATGPTIHHGGPTDDRRTLNRCESEAIARWNRRNAASTSTEGAGVIERCAKVVREVLAERAAYFQRTKGHWDREDQARSYLATAAEVDKAIRALSTPPGAAMSKLTDDRLLPCPFCGHEAVHQNHSARPGEYWYANSFIRCPNCEASGPTGSQDEAVTAWNRRAAASTSTEGAGVKALEWGVFGGDTGLASQYFVRHHDNGSWGWHLTMGPEQPERFPTADEAKAAAQADYERRVLSCLNPPAPQGDDGRSGGAGMTELVKLIERVEAATGPDRELDKALFEYTHPAGSWTDSGWNWDRRKIAPAGIVWYWLGRNKLLHAPDFVPVYTANIDAALGLVERVLPGWQVDMSTGNRWASELPYVTMNPEQQPFPAALDIGASGATLPLAIIRALLDAVAAVRALSARSP